jgi:hypothetical protein
MAEFHVGDLNVVPLPQRAKRSRKKEADGNDLDWFAGYACAHDVNMAAAPEVEEKGVVSQSLPADVARGRAKNYECASARLTATSLN